MTTINLTVRSLSQQVWGLITIKPFVNHGIKSLELLTTREPYINTAAARTEMSAKSCIVTIVTLAPEVEIGGRSHTAAGFSSKTDDETNEAKTPVSVFVQALKVESATTLVQSPATEAKPSPQKAQLLQAFR